MRQSEAALMMILAIEKQLQCPAHLRRRKRLWEKRVDTESRDSLRSIGVGIGTDHDYRGSPQPHIAANPANQLKAIHAGHIEVRDHRAHRRSRGVQDSQRFHAGRSLHDAKVRDTQKRHFQHRGVVFGILDNQDRAIPAIELHRHALLSRNG